MAAVTALGQNLSTSLTGNLPKAMLFVRKYNSRMPGASQAESLKVIDQKAKALQKTLLARTKTALAQNKALLDMGVAAATIPYAEYAAAAGSAGYCCMRVQYNPSSIYIDTAAGLRELDNSSVSNISNNQITQIKTEAITSLGMQLVFDDMDVMDAFMLDSSMLSTGAAMTAIAKATGIKRKDFTVKHEVEGLIACLLSPITRPMIFAWSDMVFYGHLFQVNAKYTMFNKQGNPIRATVEITLQQGADTESSSKGGYWDNAFNKAFGKAQENSTVGAASAFSKATNNALLNLNI